MGTIWEQISIFAYTKIYPNESNSIYKKNRKKE